MDAYKWPARFFGIFFMLSFISYAVGSGLVDTLIHAPDGLSVVYANQFQIVVGAILIAIMHTLFNAGLVIIMFRILKNYNNYLAYAYFSTAIMGTLMLAIGAIFLLLLIPLSDAFVKAEGADMPFFQILTTISTKGNFFAYQLGMALWGIGGLILCYLLYKSKIIPRFMPVWGFFGYLVFIAGTISALFGFSVGVYLNIPGGLFEVFLSVWLIIKGFNDRVIHLAK